MALSNVTLANAQKALDAYPADEPDEVEQSIGDLIADLMHLADSQGFNGETIADRARMHYDAERRGEL